MGKDDSGPNVGILGICGPIGSHQNEKTKILFGSLLCLFEYSAASPTCTQTKCFTLVYQTL